MSETSLKTTSTGCNFSDLYREEEGYWWSIARRRLITLFLRTYSTSRSPRIIDVGCGGGGFLRSLKGFGKLFGLEYSASGSIYASEKSDARIVRGSAVALPFRDNSFDALISLDVIEHLDGEEEALKDFSRVLDKDGIIILTVPAFNLLWSPRDVMLEHKRRYTVKRLRALLEKAGFKVIRCSYTNAFYFPGLLAYSLIKRLFKGDTKPKTAILSLPSWLSTVFSGLLKLEEYILTYTNIPIGTSIICVARKEPIYGSLRK